MLWTTVRWEVKRGETRAQREGVPPALHTFACRRRHSGTRFSDDGNFGDGAHRHPSELLTELNPAVQPAALDVPAGQQYLPILDGDIDQEAPIDEIGSLRCTTPERSCWSAGVATAHAGRSGPLPVVLRELGTVPPNHSTAVKPPSASSPQRAGRRRRLAPDARTARKAEPGLTKTKRIPKRVDVFGTNGSTKYPPTSHAIW